MFPIVGNAGFIPSTVCPLILQVRKEAARGSSWALGSDLWGPGLGVFSKREFRV